MVTQKQINKLKRELEKRRNAIRKIQTKEREKIERIQKFKNLSREQKILEKEIKNVKDPGAFLRRQKTKKVLNKIATVELKGLKFIGEGALRGLKATGKHLQAIADEQNRQNEIIRQKQITRNKRKKTVRKSVGRRVAKRRKRSII